ncbi:MAG: carboxymuconolactone decarboxylase family protein [Rhodobacter sp.]|nr:carboxymuconolactone decarboxylase family protein [Rhodobacter sp.]MCY4167271.1 carboxymuconolactone decarboxylase family protein [Rhodobacter sp.]MCY4243440.1 carboxymuconolactone decarboxylase family protein [Rhodobacter sp.]
MTDTPKNPFDDLIKLGSGWAKAMAPTMERIDPAAIEKMWPTMPGEVMEAFFGKTLNPDGLSAKDRLLLTLMGLTVIGANAEPQIRMTVRHARIAGATDREIDETIALAGMFGGAPAMAKAMQLASEARDGEEGE